MKQSSCQISVYFQHDLDFASFSGCSWGENFPGSSTGTTPTILSPLSQLPLTVNMPILKQFWVWSLFGNPNIQLTALSNIKLYDSVLPCMFTIVFKYLLFFNFNNKRVRRTFLEDTLCLLACLTPSYAITSDSSHTGPSWCVAKPYHDWIYRMGFSSEVFAKEKHYQTVNVFLSYEGF